MSATDKPARAGHPRQPPRDLDALEGSQAQHAREQQDRFFKNLFTTAPDFRELGRLDAEFAQVLKGRELDFNDPRSVMQLTKTLLKLHFDLKIELPPDRLCPPVTNRHNYILWLKDLLDTTSYEPAGRKVVGLDIGTGASCIYPLLGCTQRPWSFIATDIDGQSLESARKNVKLNHLESRINVVARKPSDALIPLDDLGLHSITFSMTNPPFYQSEREMLESAKKKAVPPFTACTGAKVEMVTQGGEVGFVERILAESLVLRERVQWYTAMLGFLASLTRLVEKLREHGIENYAVTEFSQGNKTRRWAIAWSFGALRPSQDAARGTKAALSKGILPAMTEMEAIGLPLPPSIKAFSDELTASIAALELMSWEWNAQTLEGIGRAEDKVWSRAWRRKKKREADMKKDAMQGVTGGNSSEGEKTAQAKPATVFGFKVFIRVLREEVSVRCRWLEGRDETTFESFRGFLKASALAAEPKKTVL